METWKLRGDSAGSKPLASDRPARSNFSARSTWGNKVSATRVGTKRWPDRTNSSSLQTCRSRASAWLVAAWLNASRSAARLTLAVR